MAGYTKQFLLQAALSKNAYYKVPVSPEMEKLFSDHYDRVGKDKFRIATALDAAAIKEFKATGYCNL